MKPHTPGPWEVSASIHWPSSIGAWKAIWGPSTAQLTHQKRICLITPNRKAESDSNARLIAAAPELLAACKAADELLSRIPKLPNHKGRKITVIRELQAAIAKATP